MRLAEAPPIDYDSNVRGWVMDIFFIRTLSAIAAGGALTVSALAQTAPQAQMLDLSNLRLSQATVAASTNVIDFENVQGPASGAGIALTNQYERSHGVSFGRGAAVHFCARVTDDVNASLCSYPNAASGQRAAVHDVRAGGATMSLNFSRPVDAVEMRINPTGGIIDEIFTVQLNGFDANGNNVASDSIRFPWRQDAFTWPTSVALKTDAASFARVTIELRRAAQQNQPVRFLIDDLALVYGAQTSDAPALAALNAQRRPAAYCRR